MNCFMELLIGPGVSSCCSVVSLVEVMSGDPPYEAGLPTSLGLKSSSPEQADCLVK